MDRDFLRKYENEFYEDDRNRLHKFRSSASPRRNKNHFRNYDDRYYPRHPRDDSDSDR